MVKIEMKRRQLLIAVVGLFMALGLLWFLQGAAVLRICPVVCISNCECVTGGSQFWEAVGAIALIVGITIIILLVRRKRMP
jgi:uncharacterized membrane protein